MMLILILLFVLFGAGIFFFFTRERSSRQNLEARVKN